MMKLKFIYQKEHKVEKKIRIPNKGYYINKDERGDLVAEVKVVVPKHITEKEKKNI